MNKRCANCHRVKGKKAFHQNQNTCIACNAVLSELERHPKREQELLLIQPIREFEKSTKLDCSPLRREAQTFLSEYLSAHWEPACISLGRLTEAATFLAAEKIGIRNLAGTNSEVGTIIVNANALKKHFQDLVGEEKVPDQVRERIYKNSTELTRAVLELNAHIDRYTAQPKRLKEDTPSYSHCMSQIHKKIITSGKTELVSVFLNLDNMLRTDIMEIRNSFAHASWSEDLSRLSRRRLSKKRLALMHSAVEQSILIFSRLVKSL